MTNIPRNMFEQIHLTHSDNYVPARQPVPTQTRPGSPERLAELVRRAEAGEELWHPEDRTCRLNRYESVLRHSDEDTPVFFYNDPTAEDDI